MVVWTACQPPSVQFSHRGGRRTASPIEYWMIYRGPGFIAVIWFGFFPTPYTLSRQQVVYLSHSSCVSPVEGEGRGEAKSYDGEKAWSSINHSLLVCTPNPSAPLSHLPHPPPPKGQLIRLCSKFHKRMKIGWIMNKIGWFKRNQNWKPGFAIFSCKSLHYQQGIVWILKFRKFSRRTEGFTRCFPFVDLL